MEIQGLQQLLAKLNNLESLVVRKRIVARAVRKGIDIIHEEAKQLAPRGDTGLLEEGIMGVVSEQTASEAIGKVGPSRGRGFHGIFQELGTGHHPPQPFLQPAFDNKADEALAAVAKTLASEIDDATR